MATVSIGSAVGAGFNLIGRRFLSVIGWGLFLQVFAFALLIISVLIVGIPVVAQLARLRDVTDPSQAWPALLTFLIALWPALLVFVVGMMFANAMVQGAIFRSVLMPQERSWASLRLSGREGALVLLYLLMIPIVILVEVVSVALLFAVGFVAERLLHGVAGALLVLFPVWLAYGLALMWLALRFSLAAPMTFAEGRVRFFGSWALTRGHGWSMFGLGWVMVLVLVGVYILYAIVSLIVSTIFGGGLVAALASSGAANDTSAVLARLPVLLLGYIPSLVLGVIFQGMFQAISQGPWVDAYRQLRGAPDPSAAFS